MLVSCFTSSADYDASASFVNQLNRIKLMLGCAQDQIVSTEKQMLCHSCDLEDVEACSAKGCSLSGSCQLVKEAQIKRAQKEEQQHVTSTVVT